MPKARKQAKSVTLAEIARACGVSTPVVSLVLRGKTSSSVRYGEETASRVRAIAKEMGYRPNRASRGHFGKRHDSIGLLVDRVFSLSSLALQAIHAEVAARGWLLVVERHVATEPGVPTLVKEHAVDGLLIPSEVSPEVAARILELGIPAVWVNTNRTEGPGVLTYDEVGGMALAVDHLSAVGRDRILYVQTNCDEHYSAAARQAGLLAACERKGLPTPTFGLFQRGGGVEATVTQLAESLRANSVCNGVVTHTETAPFVYTAARRLGLAVPGDLAVVGIGGGDLPSLLDPPLTTIAVGQWDLGYKAVHALAALIEGTEVGVTSLPYDLHPAASTGTAFSPH